MSGPKLIIASKHRVFKTPKYFIFGNRLFMILEVDESFSFERKAALNASNPNMEAWEALMWDYQQALPNTPPGTKWILMNKIYDLNKNE